MGRRVFYSVLFVSGICLNGFCQNDSDTTKYKSLQKFELISFDYTSYSSSEYQSDDKVGVMSVEEYRTKLQFALKLKEKKTYMLHKIDMTRFDAYSEEGSLNEFSKHYYSFSYSLGLIKVLPKKWTLVGLVTPTLASDFDEKTSFDDFILQSSVMATKRASENMEYGFGVAYSTRFGRALVIPLLTYTYVKNNWHHEAVLPAYLASYYSFNKFDAGLKLSIFGNLYNSNNSAASDLELDKLGYSRINIGPAVRMCVYKSIYANINTGITVRNRLSSMNGQGELELEIAADPKYFINIGLSILK